MHSLLSDFSSYSKWARRKQLSLSTFVVSLLEDVIINKHLGSSFPWAIAEIAYANAITYLRMKSVEELPNNASRVMASALTKYNVGKVKGTLKDELLTDVKAITSILEKKLRKTPH